MTKRFIFCTLLLVNEHLPSSLLLLTTVFSFGKWNFSFFTTDDIPCWKNFIGLCDEEKLTSINTERQTESQLANKLHF